MQELNFQPLAPGEPRPFWEHPVFLAFLVVASAVPLLWPDIAPLVDLPGHMGRYRVQLDLGTSPALQQFYNYEWALIGNLGVDLLVELLAPLMGLEPAVRLIVLMIPALTAAGLIWAAFEVHGRVPPTVLFALPFAYNFPFLFGFVNFALAMALALNAFALWLRLGRLHQVRLRAILFVPISIILWVVHAFGWGTLGVLAFSAELVRQHDRGRGYIVGSFHAAKHCLSMALPILMMIYWRSNAGGQTGDWFNWTGKAMWLFMTLRDRWITFDILALGVVSGVLIFAWASRRIEYSRNLVASALFLLLVFVMLPRVIFGSAYADMRLTPYIFAIALVAIRFPTASRRLVTAFGAAGLVFFAARTAGTTVSMVMYDRAFDATLAALDHVPRGARLVSFVGRPCVEPWAMSRLLHLPAMAIVRREAFSNDQWVLPGAQLLTIRFDPGANFIQDASQIVTRVRCRHEPWRTVDQALGYFPRHSFDYVWMIDPPQHDPRLLEGLLPVWRNGTSVLYRVVDRSPVANPPLITRG
ncbi:hypothetical protein [Sphingosinicella sp.]|uniref:hypothetical protein n=1 Tax=Sphingosinicella sp. TaxID=1917971 RepID=UPI0040378779